MGLQVSMTSEKSIVILASGEGSVAQAIFDSVADSNGALQGKIIISRVITENPDAGILRRAQRAGIAHTVIPFDKSRERAAWERELHNAVAQARPWLVVSAGFMKILSPEFVKSFRIINTHPSLLPLFPGAHAVRDALAAGATTSGCTLHFVDEGVDTGEIIDQRHLEIASGESEASLHGRIKELERELIITGILRLLEKGQE